MVDPLSGGPAESPGLLARQAAQHWAELPAAPTDDPGWILVEEGFHTGARARSGILVRDRKRLCRIAWVTCGGQRALRTCDFRGGSIRFGGRLCARACADCRLDPSVRDN